MKKTQGISFFDKYLTIWVALCIAAGILIGKLFPSAPLLLGKLEYFNVSIPVAILIWVMIFPMMLKVDFSSVVNALKMPKGLTVTLIVNWLVKPFTMFGLAWLFFHIIFKTLIPETLANEYVAGAVLFGGSSLYGNGLRLELPYQRKSGLYPDQVAINDLIILIAFIPHCHFIAGNNGCVEYSWNTLILSVVLFVVIPLVAGVIVCADYSFDARVQNILKTCF